MTQSTDSIVSIEDHVQRAQALLEHILRTIDICDRADIKFALWQARNELAAVLAEDVQHA